jgi:hypothetical protein
MIPIIPTKRLKMKGCTPLFTMVGTITIKGARVPEGAIFERNNAANSVMMLPIIISIRTFSNIKSGLIIFNSADQITAKEVTRAVFPINPDKAGTKSISWILIGSICLFFID